MTSPTVAVTKPGETSAERVFPVTHKRRLVSAAGLLLRKVACVWLGAAFWGSAAVLLASASPAVGAASGPLKITVYGGTGALGSRIVDEALRRGHVVTVAVRDPSKSSAPRERLRIVAGDALDSASIARQAAGQDVLIEAVSDRGASKAFHVNVAHAMVGALRSLGPNAPRLITVGGASSLKTASGQLLFDVMPRPANLPPLIPNEWESQVHALEYYRSVHDANWTFISPPPMLELNPAKSTRTGKYRIGGDQVLLDASGQSRISMEDLAVAILDEAEHPRHVRRRFTVAY